MFNFESFGAFAKLDKTVAREAMNNADQRMLDHRKTYKSISILKATDEEIEESNKYFVVQEQLSLDAMFYADVWAYLVDQEYRHQDALERQNAFSGVYPVVGTRYVIREWDDSLNQVTVLATSKEEQSVTFTYESGLTHKVSAEYFAVGLNATGVQ